MKIVKVSVIVALGLGLSLLHANEMKKYDVKSGKITYELKGNGNVMGMVQVKSTGKKRVIFDNYGVKNLEEKVEVKKETTMGKTKTDKTHTLMYMNDAIIYKVDFEKKIVNRMKNRGAALAGLFGGGANLKESGEAMMIKMGGKKIGTDKVLGYACVVWDLMGSKQCMYKGIPLKVEIDVMGMKTTEVATKAEFDIALSKDDFKLPDYPVYDFDMDRMMDGQKPKELDKSRLEAMDTKDNVKAKEESKEAAEGMKALGAGFAALAKEGIDMNKELTPEQEKIMKKAMMKAMAKSMGGEDKMLAKMKQKILKESKIEEMQFAQECFGSADTLKEVNLCVDKGNKIFNDDEEYFESWTAKDKQEMLDEIKEFGKMIPCIKEAQTMEAFQKCMPEER